MSVTAHGWKTKVEPEVDHVIVDHGKIIGLITQVSHAQ